LVMCSGFVQNSHTFSTPALMVAATVIVSIDLFFGAVIFSFENKSKMLMMPKKF
jgi:hypothetical protein